MKILHSELEYTGGGIWCAWGELEDGTICLGSDNESFGIFPKTILDYVVESDDWREAVDIFDASDFVEVIRWTDDHSDETFDMWLQIYNQHTDCVDLDRLLDDLYEFNGKERPREDSDEGDNPDHTMSRDEKVKRVSEMTAEQLLDALDYYHTHWNPIDEDMWESRDIVKAEIIKRMEK